MSMIEPDRQVFPGKLSDPALSLLAETLDGLESLRIATENRYRTLTRDEPDSDGVMRGLGMNVLHPQVATVKNTLHSLEDLEHGMTLAVQRHIRTTPFAAWIKESKGIGEKQAARLLASLGDPYWHPLENRPRTVSELWAYAGYSVQGGEAQKRRKGQPANWNATAKMRAFLVAESCVKVGGSGGYRTIYDDARTQYAGAFHAIPCPRCGPAGKPAPIGSELSLGHQHARALRMVAKTILEDVWIIARDWYSAQEQAEAA